MKKEECIFCKIVKKEISAEIIYEDDNFIGFLDINPKAEGHSLIVSKKHYRNILDMPVTLGNELVESIKKVSLDLVGRKKCEGVNIIFNIEPAAGQIVMHFHCHIIPRKSGDGLKSLV